MSELEKHTLNGILTDATEDSERPYKYLKNCWEARDALKSIYFRFGGYWLEAYPPDFVDGNCRLCIREN